MYFDVTQSIQKLKSYGIEPLFDYLVNNKGLDFRILSDGRARFYDSNGKETDTYLVKSGESLDFICYDHTPNIHPELSQIADKKNFDVGHLLYKYHNIGTPKGRSFQIAFCKKYDCFVGTQTSTIAGGTTQKPNPNAQTLIPIVQKKVQKKGVQPSQNLPTIPQILTWCSKIGKELLGYFEQKTGCGDADFLTKHGISPTRPQYCKHQYLAEANGLVMVRKVEPNNPKTTRAYRAGDWSKFPETSYLFGSQMFPTSPKETDILIFCEGQTDANCINYHLNAYGIYAVTVGSASTGYLSEGEANRLKSLFSNIFVLWDNDNTGKNSKAFADAHGFGWIDEKAFFGEGLKDICEAWGKAFDHFLTGNYPNPKERAQNLLLELFKENTKKSPPKPTKSTIPAITGDRFSIGVEQAISYEFNQYLGEKISLKTVLDTILRTPRLALQAPAGAGKTTLLLELAKCVGKPTLIFAPVRWIVEQNAQAFKAQIKAQNLDLELLLINKHTHTSDTEIHINTYGNNAIIIGTYDCLTPNRFPTELLQKCCLVFDESHQFANDFNYRNTAMGRVEDVLKNPNQPALLLSATPNYFFNSRLVDMLNFNLFVGIPHIQNTIRLQPILYDKNKKFAIETLYDRIEAHRIAHKALYGTNGVVLVKFDSVDTLEVWERFLLKKGAKVSVFASKGKAEYQTNPNITRIVGENLAVEMDELEEDPSNFDQPIEETTYKFVSGELAEHVDFILTTTKSEAGVSFNFAVDLVIAVDTLAASRLIQFANRPRYNTSTGVNKVVDFWVLLPEKIETKKDQSMYPPTATQIFKEHLNNAQIEAEGFNDILTQATNRTEIIKNILSGKDVISSKNNKFVRYSLRSQVFEVSIFSILYDIHQKETNGSNLNDILTRIQHTDKRIKILPTQTLSIEKTSELEGCFEEIKEAKEAKETAFLELCKKDFYTVAKVLAKDAKKGTKVILEGFLDAQPAYFDPNFADQHKQAFEFEDKTTYALRIIKEFEKAGYPVKRPRNKTIEGFVNAVFERSESETRTLATRDARTNLWRLYAKGEVSPTDRRELEKEIHPAIKTLKTRLTDIKKNKFVGTTEGFEPAEFYAALYNQHITQNVKFSAITAIELVKVDFELEEKRDRKDDKDRTLYALKDRVKKTPK
jgi:DEAD/DEAH box helicase